MRSGSLGVAVVGLLSACQDGGVQIVVYPSSDPTAVAIDEVRLYVSDGVGQTARLGTPNFGSNPMRRGEIYTRDSSDIGFDHHALGAPDEVSSFTYASTADGQHLSVIAVGMSGGQPTSAFGLYDLPVPTDRVAVYEIGLNPTTPFSPNIPVIPGGKTQLEMWGERPGDQTCVQLFDRGGYHDDRHPLAAITTPGDLDCDGYLAGTPEECEDRQFHSSVVPGTSSLSCLVPDMVTTAGGSIMRCRVGGLSCVDGLPATRNNCSTTPSYCAPTALCDLCPPKDQKFEDCAIDPVNKDPMGTLNPVLCKIPVAKDAMTGVETVCPHTMTFKPALSSPASCAHPTFHGPDPNDRWEPTIDLLGGSYTVTPDLNDSCKWHANPMPLLTDPASLPFGGLFAFDLSPALGVVVPLVIAPSDSFLPACPSTPMDVMCQLEAAAVDVLRTCITASGG